MKARLPKPQKQEQELTVRLLRSSASLTVSLQLGDELPDLHMIPTVSSFLSEEIVTQP